MVDRKLELGSTSRLSVFGLLEISGNKYANTTEVPTRRDGTPIRENMASTTSSSRALKYFGLCQTVKNLAFKGAKKVFGLAKKIAEPCKGPIEVVEGIVKKCVSPFSKVADKALTFADNVTDRAVTCVENILPGPLKVVVKGAKKVPQVLNDVLVLGPVETFLRLLGKLPGLLLSLLIKILTCLVRVTHGPQIFACILRGQLFLAKIWNSGVLRVLKCLRIPILKLLPPIPVNRLELLLHVVQHFSEDVSSGENLVQALTHALTGDRIGLIAHAANLGFDTIGKLPPPSAQRPRRRRQGSQISSS